MKKNDVILLVILSVVFLGVYLFTDVFSFSKQGGYEVHVRDSKGNLIVKDINESGRFKILSDDEDYYNEYEIKDGMVNMLDSNCKDKLCVKMKKISKNGEMIVCLPHKTYISIHSRDKSVKDSEDKLDAIAE